MLISKEVNTTWNPTTREHYESMGYTFTKYRDSFKVKVEDLLESSNLKIKIECDYCNTTVNRTYSDYLRRKSIYVPDDACKSCTQKKEKDINDIKQKRGLLTREDKGFWSYKNNRISSLLSFIEINGISIDKLSEKDRTLYDAIWKYDSSVESLLNELGHSWDSLCSVGCNNNYKDFNKVKTKIEWFISEYNRFPTKLEIIKELKIQQRDIDYHGGIFEIKRKMKYESETDLIDSSGFYNRSVAELTVSEFLIANKIEYLREQKPFPKNEGNYRSDFTLKKDSQVFHVELWGYSENEKCERSMRYIRFKNVKLGLYKKHRINLIEIDYKDLSRVSKKRINKLLTEKFEKFLPHY